MNRKECLLNVSFRTKILGDWKHRRHSTGEAFNCFFFKQSLAGLANLPDLAKMPNIHIRYQKYSFKNTK